jgi:aminopeptidase
MVHVDWMIGSEEVDVDGLLEDGTRVPLMRRGLWVI